MSSRGWRITLLLLLAIAIVAFILWRRTLIRPAWYDPPDRHDSRVAQLAEDVEYAVVEKSHRVRPAEESWTLRLTEDQINAWLAARLADWASHDQQLAWLEALGPPQVKLASSGVTVGIPLDHGPGARVLEAHFSAALRNGQLSMMVDRVALGRVSLPGSPVAAVLEQLTAVAGMDESTRQQVRQSLERIFDGRAFDAALTLEDGRVVQLDEMRQDEGQVLLKCRTQPANSDKKQD